MILRTLCGAALAVAIACTSAQAQQNLGWGANATAFAGSGIDTVTVSCQPNGRAATVWGSGIYTADSSVCTAAVHAGLITLQRGGTFVVRMRPGMPGYSGTVRNGITTESYDAWEASFSVQRAPPPPPEPEPVVEKPPPPPPPADEPRIAVIDWNETARRLAPNGRRFTFRCSARGTAAPVHGAGLYSWDSSICTAAAHAGIITPEKGGLVTIEMRPGASRYESDTRNGITSAAGPRTTLGFIVIREDDTKP